MSSTPASRSSKSSKPGSKHRRYAMKDVPRSQIDFLVGNLHVGTPDEEVAADIRKRCEGSKFPAPVVTLCVKYALDRHHKNGGMYSDVMSGNLDRKRRMSREDGHASGEALTDRFSRMPGTYELYFFVVKAALMERYGFSAEQTDTLLARPRTKTWVRASFRASYSPALMAADLSKAAGERHRGRRGHSIGRQKLTYTPDPYPHAPDTTRDAPDTERSPEPSFGRPTRQKLTYTPNPHPQHTPPARQKLTYTPPGYSRGRVDDGLYVVQAIWGGRVVMSSSFDKKVDAVREAREFLSLPSAEYTSVRIITRDGDLVSNHRVGDKRRKSR